MLFSKLKVKLFLQTSFRKVNCLLQAIFFRSRNSTSLLCISFSEMSSMLENRQIVRAVSKTAGSITVEKDKLHRFSDIYLEQGVKFYLEWY